MVCFSWVLQNFDQSTISTHCLYALHKVGKQCECSCYSNVHINQLNTMLNERSGHSILVMVQGPGNLFSENNRLLFWPVKLLYPGQPKKSTLKKIWDITERYFKPFRMDESFNFPVHFNVFKII